MQYGDNENENESGGYSERRVEATRLRILGATTVVVLAGVVSDCLRRSAG